MKYKMKFSLKHEGVGVGKNIKPEVRIYIANSPLPVENETINAKLPENW